ncbi:AEC family transporter [Rubellicoccus peritrichatus]|uniref:AEC family transporter n=1 Tax=Rubellicoccus peritrichatus TaxID=3080537 RepID=A0AAQ3L9N7_9BACT|nr:AEC family transporter [Puniceicoccus sp. CR14]WOO39895.1 AEC family transporter [Puniceicoccus sp. CR14]
MGDMVVHIIFYILAPVFILIGLGALLDRLLNLDAKTLVQLNFYVFVPALVAVKIIDSPVSLAEFGGVAIAALLSLLLCGAVAWLIAGRGKLRPQRPLLVSTAMFTNAGNVGIPVAALAFPDFGAAYMGAILMVQNFACFSIGMILLADMKPKSALDFIKVLLPVPVTWAIVLALIIRSTNLHVPEPLFTPLSYLGDGLIPVALLTLGVQLRRSLGGSGDFIFLTVGMLLRLLLGPLIVFAVAILLPLPEEGRQVLILSGVLPVAVNVYILAARYESNASLASQLVFWSTVLSPIGFVAVLLFLSTG